MRFGVEFALSTRRGNVSSKIKKMDSWKEKLKLEDDELVTTYLSTVFKVEISIRLMGTSDKVHPKQEQIISQLITEESKWIEKAILAIIDYYKDTYSDYKLGWELGGTDEATIEKYLPQEINREKLFKLITPGEIYINQEEECESGRFGFGLACEWDVEHGLGVYFDNWEITDTGDMDVAFGY